MHIYPDPLLGGEWCWCPGCRFAGDMVALAAKAWKLETRAVVRKLLGPAKAAEVLQSSAGEAYFQETLPRLQQGQAFWTTCQQNAARPDTAELRILQQQFQIAPQAIGNDWFHRLVGASTREEVCRQLPGKNPFRSKDWGALLVLPMQDLPGRISGFIYLGRDGDPIRDVLFHSLWPSQEEAGIGMLDALLQPPHSQLGESRFLFLDPGTAIRYQARHARENTRPLPLGIGWAAAAQETRNVWDWLSGEHLVIWGPEPLQAIAQARMAGCFAVSGLPRFSLGGAGTPVEALQRLPARAKTWNLLLEDYLTDAAELTAEAALQYMNFTRTELTQFITGCRPELQKRLEYISANRRLGARLRFNGRWITERDEGWFLTNGDCICNFVVRIEQVVATETNSYYRGHVRFRGETLPFFEKAERLDSGMFEWAVRWLRDTQKVGIGTYFPRWNRHSLALALAFSPPEFIRGTQTVGWDSETRRFVFPTFSIGAGGAVVEEKLPEADILPLPAAKIAIPGPFPVRYRELLSEDNPETRIVWATAAAVVANILAPVLRYPLRPIVLAAGAGLPGQEAAVVLGCQELVLRPARPILPQLLKQPRHGWPLVLKGQTKKLGDWFFQEEARNIVCSLNSGAAAYLQLRDAGYVIFERDELGRLQMTMNAAAWIIPNYLQSLYRRHLFLPEPETSPARNVLADMKAWFAELGGQVPESAFQALRDFTDQDKRFAAKRLLHHLVYKGLLRTREVQKLSPDILKPGDGIVALPYRNVDRRPLWISREALVSAARRAIGVPPDMLLLQRWLSDHAAWKGEHCLGDRPGWLFSVGNMGVWLREREADATPRKRRRRQ